jgi:hypothetical protein
MEDGTQQVEWLKSSYSGGSGTECVETAHLASCTAVRDSKDPSGRRLAFSVPVWMSFVAALRNGRLD